MLLLMEGKEKEINVYCGFNGYLFYYSQLQTPRSGAVKNAHPW